MKEFGSDFHYIEQGSKGRGNLFDIIPSANYYADGRQALIHLYWTQGWERLWIPDYFCYEVVDSLSNAGLHLQFYSDLPFSMDDDCTLDALARDGQFNLKDAVLRVNYFGTRRFRSAADLPVPVIEDHTHDLIGDWPSKSNADWCIASLRKTLPIPEGGILWSPSGLPLPEPPERSDDNEVIASVRWEAMRMKSRYLAGEDVDKAEFRSVFIDTEGFYDTASVCSLDKNSQDYLASFDIADWYRRKLVNWDILRSIDKEGIKILKPDDSGCNPFSLIMLFDSEERRGFVRQKLIDKQVYPAVLWSIPGKSAGEAFEFSCRMLSIHCDGRYSPEEILHMKLILDSIL